MLVHDSSFRYMSTEDDGMMAVIIAVLLFILLRGAMEPPNMDTIGEIKSACPL